MRKALLSTGAVTAFLLLAAAVPAAEKAGAGGKGKAVAKADPARGADSDEKIAEELRKFCLKWMGFLEQRERDNKRGIKWQPRATGVAGQFVGYSKEYDCVMKERSSNGTPVATIMYREVLYEQSGGSQNEATNTPPKVIETTEITEIFRYTKGQWVY
ncbi:MAG: hypothetical protein AB7V27_08980 [Candidatus Binatia bacterium]